MMEVTTVYVYMDPVNDNDLILQESEVTVEAAKLDETLSAIKACHPYEEPGINVIPLYKIGL